MPCNIIRAYICTYNIKRKPLDAKFPSPNETNINLVKKCDSYRVTDVSNSLVLRVSDRRVRSGHPTKNQ